MRLEITDENGCVVRGLSTNLCPILQPNVVHVPNRRACCSGDTSRLGFIHCSRIFCSHAFSWSNVHTLNLPFGNT